MRKQEFIHLHGLLAEVTSDFRDRGRTIEFDAYHEQGTRPTSIHKSKTAHKKAVMTLADELVQSLEAEQENRTVTTAAD